MASTLWHSCCSTLQRLARLLHGQQQEPLLLAMLGVDSPTAWNSKQCFHRCRVTHACDVEAVPVPQLCTMYMPSA